MKQRIGFVGLGLMGQPMARRLLKAGFSLTIWNRTLKKTRYLARRGATVANTPSELASQSDIIITMVSHGKALRAVTMGPDGILSSLQSGAILIDMSTIDPPTSQDVSNQAEERGGSMLRAPVSGSTEFAAAGKLTIVVSGDAMAYRRCESIFKTLGRKTFYMGAKDEARYMKLVLNIMVGVTCEILAEALTFGKKSGLNWDQMLEIIGDSVVASPFVLYKMKPLVERNFKPMFTASMMAKDFDLALDVGQELNIATPITSQVRQLLGVLKATGRSDLDLSALVLLMEELSGVRD